MEDMINAKSHPAIMKGSPIAKTSFSPRIDHANILKGVSWSRKTEIVEISHYDSMITMFQYPMS